MFFSNCLCTCSFKKYYSINFVLLAARVFAVKVVEELMLLRLHPYVFIHQPTIRSQPGRPNKQTYQQTSQTIHRSIVWTNAAEGRQKYETTTTNSDGDASPVILHSTERRSTALPNSGWRTDKFQQESYIVYFPCCPYRSFSALSTTTTGCSCVWPKRATQVNALSTLWWHSKAESHKH